MKIISFTDDLPEDDVVLAAARSLDATIMAIRQRADFADALLRNPDAVGIFHSPTRFAGSELALSLRQAGVRNLLFALLPNAEIYRLAVRELLFAGADQAQHLPIEAEELAAFLRALMRRVERSEQQIITIGPLEVDLGRKTVCVDDHRVDLSGMEFAIVELLAIRKDKIVPRSALIQHIYTGVDEAKPKIIDVFICKIRKKLQERNCDLIQTVWGCGYVLRSQPGEGAL